MEIVHEEIDDGINKVASHTLITRGSTKEIIKSVPEIVYDEQIEYEEYEEEVEVEVEVEVYEERERNEQPPEEKEEDSI